MSESSTLRERKETSRATRRPRELTMVNWFPKHHRSEVDNHEAKTKRKRSEVENHEAKTKRKRSEVKTRRKRSEAKTKRKRKR